MKVGYSRLAITPPLGVNFGGGAPRTMIGVLDDICATAIAFSDGERTAVIITIDILELARRDNDIIRDMISEAYGLERDAIFVHSTHSHSTPEVSGHMYEPNSAYVDYFHKRVKDAAGFAIADMKDATFFSSVGVAENTSFVRRYILGDGSGKTNPAPDADVVRHETEPDNTVPFIKITRKGAHDIVIVNFAAHPCTCTGRRATADFVHFVRLTLELSLSDEADGRGVKVAYFSGALGDAVAQHYSDKTELGYKYSRHVGRKIAAAVMCAYTYAEEINTDRIVYRIDEVDIPSFKATGEPYKLLLSCIGIGDIAFVGFPGEPYTEIGRRVKRDSAFKMTIPCCNTNDWHSYIPMEYSYPNGGYGVEMNGIRPGGAEIFIEKAISLTKELKK